jgi:hypothetical protein
VAGYHIVKQGEHIASIAENYGFSQYSTIWNDAANADIRKQRDNPSVLSPGDKLLFRTHRIRSIRGQLRSGICLCWRENL